jgi:hypothetical protein
MMSECIPKRRSDGDNHNLIVSIVHCKSGYIYGYPTKRECVVIRWVTTKVARSQHFRSQCF